MLAERENPVNLFAPAPISEPESLKPEMTFIPDPSTRVVSLCVSRAVASDLGFFTSSLPRELRAKARTPPSPKADRDVETAAEPVSELLITETSTASSPFFPYLFSNMQRAAPDRQSKISA